MFCITRLGLGSNVYLSNQAGETYTIDQTVLNRAVTNSFCIPIQKVSHGNVIGTTSSYVCHIGNNYDVLHMLMLPVMHETDMIEDHSSNSLSCDESNKSSEKNVYSENDCSCHGMMDSTYDSSESTGNNTPILAQ